MALVFFDTENLGVEMDEAAIKRAIAHFLSRQGSSEFDQKDVALLYSPSNGKFAATAVAYAALKENPMTDLKLCPFCGGKGKGVSGGPGRCYVSCTPCPAETDDGSVPRIMAAWNTRTTTPAEAAERISKLKWVEGSGSARDAAVYNTAIEHALRALADTQGEPHER